MALTVTKLTSSDPGYDPAVDRFRVDGTYANASLGFTTPAFITLAQAQELVATVTAQQNQAMQRYAAPLASANELLAAVQAVSGS